MTSGHLGIYTSLTDVTFGRGPHNDQHAFGLRLHLCSQPDFCNHASLIGTLHPASAPDSGARSAMRWEGLRAELAGVPSCARTTLKSIASSYGDEVCGGCRGCMPIMP